MVNAAILGAGSFGTALGLLLHRKGCGVTLIAHDAAYAATVARTRESPRYLPGVRLPEAIGVLSAAEPPAAPDLLVVAVPSQHLRSALLPLAPRLSNLPTVSVVKGIENGTLKRPSEILRELLRPKALAVLSGPSHAQEVARSIPTSVAAASEDASFAARTQELFSSERFRVYTNPDVTGVELGGCLKQPIALAAGISDGLGFGDNTKAALITRGLAEIARFGAAFGARTETFFGLAGIGDIVVSSFSPHGRNRAVGEAVGKGKRLAEVLASMAQVAEGVPTSRSVRDLARGKGIEMPITQEVCRVLFEDKPPVQALWDLMQRSLKGEG